MQPTNEVTKEEHINSSRNFLLMTVSSNNLSVSLRLQFMLEILSEAGMSAAENKPPFKPPPTYFDQAKPAADCDPKIGSSRLKTAWKQWISIQILQAKFT